MARTTRKRSAKGQFVSGRATRVRRRRNPDAAPAATGATLLAPKENPAPMEDLVEFVIPGFAGYAGTRLLHRIIYTQLSKKYPSAGKHVAAASTVASAAIAWMMLHRIERLAKYHTPAVVGSAIASIQTLLQLYIPRFGWMVSDVETASATAPTMITAPTAMAPERLFPGGPEIVDDNASVEDDLNDLSKLNLGSLEGGLEDDYQDALN